MKKEYETIALEKKTKRELKVFAAINGYTLSKAVNVLLRKAKKFDKIMEGRKNK